MGDLPYLDLVANGHKFFLTQQTLEGLPHLPGLENGPGFDSQGSVNFFTKYCFPNLHWIHDKALEVQDWGPGLLTIQKSKLDKAIGSGVSAIRIKYWAISN